MLLWKKKIYIYVYTYIERAFDWCACINENGLGSDKKKRERERDPPLLPAAGRYRLAAITWKLILPLLFASIARSPHFRRRRCPSLVVSEKPLTEKKYVYSLPYTQRMCTYKYSSIRLFIYIYIYILLHAKLLNRTLWFYSPRVYYYDDNI